MNVKTILATRYVTPLREGGSLPAVVEADDGELYVLKFSGAGQGPKALVAELIAGEIARALGLPVPELAFVELAPDLGATEPDEEIRDLLRASAGLNLGMRYLSKAFAFNPLVKPAPDAGFASAVVWFDSYVTNVDRTVRNTNILVWQGGLWLIDHGAALYFHFDWGDYLERSRSPFAFVKNHVLLPFASALPEADLVLRDQLTPAVIRQAVELVPDAWLVDGVFGTAAEQRSAYLQYLESRLEAAPIFLEEAMHARSLLV